MKAKTSRRRWPPCAISCAHRTAWWRSNWMMTARVRAGGRHCDCGEAAARRQREGIMIVISSGVKVDLAARLHRHAQRSRWSRHLIQEQLKKEPFSGQLFVFRGKNASLLKILFWDGTELCLFTKRIDHGRLVGPRLAEPGEVLAVSSLMDTIGSD
ncbi:IS66 family insertion sequence element accessory protein TnpB [Mesorhizobium sp. M0898]|uniref:IS66 family insertion sequence element accessory protein TnpB n=1 Tax=Mesorhizobium sp. M0898 TaxID=2957020 RepID=UPI00333AA6C4